MHTVMLMPILLSCYVIKIKLYILKLLFLKSYIYTTTLFRVTTGSISFLLAPNAIYGFSLQLVRSGIINSVLHEDTTLKPPLDVKYPSRLHPFPL